MNGVLERYEVKLKQTSKGIWYCDGLTITHEKILEVLVLTDDLMTQIEEILTKHNQVEE